jgi:hypothetical protein
MCCVGGGQCGDCRNAAERHHSDTLAFEAKTRELTRELQAMSLIAADLLRERERLVKVKAERLLEISHVRREMEKEREACVQLHALSQRMRSELTRLTVTGGSSDAPSAPPPLNCC